MQNHIFFRCLKVGFIFQFLFFFLSSCALFDLAKEVKEYKKSYGLVGKVIGSSNTKPKIVILYTEEDTKKKIVEYTLTEDTGHFSFIVKKGTYYLTAFEDNNNNFSYDAQEPAGFYGAPDRIIVSPESLTSVGARGIKDLYIQLKQAGGLSSDFPSSLDPETFRSKSFVKIGSIIDLDDKIFADENGSTGYWKPLTFLRDIGIGVYFVEPYDSNKIPILFVHGATGTPASFKTIAEQIDRQKYQPWFFYYPSGLRLDRLSRALNNIVKTLHTEHEFNTLYVTAHSMGGLVARSFILKNLYEDKQDYIKLFISISTPWNGHRLTKKGVERTPAVIPSWYDMVPESEFIQSIYKQDLSPKMNSYLFFSFQGDCSIMLENNDGSVELSSELDYRAQNDAVRIFGFDEDHTAILESQSAIEQYNQILSSQGR